MPLPATAVVARGEAARQLARSLLRRDDADLAELRGVATLMGPSTGDSEPLASSGQSGVRLESSGPTNRAERPVPTLLVTGRTELLPWADGAVYLGHSGAASRILWPVLWNPRVSAALLEKAMLTRHGDLSAPLALVPQWGLLVPLGLALAVERDHLQRFLKLHWPAGPGAVAAP